MQPDRATVLVLGEALVDEFSDRQVAGGAPLNVARSLAALGVPALLGTRLGAHDAGAALILGSMGRFGLDRAGLQFDAQHPTGRVRVIESSGSHRFHIDEDAAWDWIEAAPLLALARQQRHSVVYFGSLAQRQPVSRASLRGVLQACGERQALRFLDLNLREGASEADLTAACLQQADWVKLNDAELGQLLAWFDLPGRGDDAPAALSGAVSLLMRRFALRRLVLTRGALGYASFDADGRVEAQGEAVAVPALADTVGAGDAFSAMLLAASLSGVELASALALANGFAAAMCGQRGPAPADDDFFLPWRRALTSTRSNA